MSEKIDKEKFFSILKNIGGLIELREYNIKPSDLEDSLLKFLVQQYFNCFDNLKKLEKAIYNQEVKDGRK